MDTTDEDSSVSVHRAHVGDLDDLRPEFLGHLAVHGDGACEAVNLRIRRGVRIFSRATSTLTRPGECSSGLVRDEGSSRDRGSSTVVLKSSIPEAKWSGELDYRLIKELWVFQGKRIAMRYTHEGHDDSANWFRSYGNENWDFRNDGPMRWRYSSINDTPLAAWQADGHPSLTELGL